MAESLTEDGYLGEFRRGPAIFTVFQTDTDPPTYLVDCSDGNGPSEVCRLSNAPGSAPTWHGAWRGDQWCAWIEAETRKVIDNPT